MNKKEFTGLMAQLYSDLEWKISNDAITAAGTIPGIITAREVIVYPEYSVLIIFTRQSLDDADRIERWGCFTLYSTGQRWGAAKYTLDWSTGTITISNQYASDDCNSTNDNHIDRVAYR